MTLSIKKYEADWEEAIKVISTKRLSGLEVHCPQCNNAGTLVSKWVKCSQIKPLYVVHSNGNGDFKICPLNSHEATMARSKIRLRAKELIKIIRLGKVFVLFSGGKDSLCLLEYMRRLCNQINKEITAIHVDTTAGFPEVEKYVKDVCLSMGVPLITVKPQHNYFELAKIWGIPGVRSRWCCETLKIAPIRRFLKDIEGQIIIFDGIRAAESNIRATYVPLWYHPTFRCISVSPIFFWSDKKIYDYIRINNLSLSAVAGLKTSGECWCGAYKKKSDFEALLKLKPGIFDKLVEVEKAQKGKYTFIYENGRQIPLISLKPKVE